MTYSCTDFADDILEALGIDVPDDIADNPDAQADLAIAEIIRLKERGARRARTPSEQPNGAPTPGPWEIRPVPSMHLIAIAQVGAMLPHGSAGRWTHTRADQALNATDYANGRMMAAAPRMADALRAIVNLAGHPLFPGVADLPAWAERLEEARAALAEADGITLTEEAEQP